MKVEVNGEARVFDPPSNDYYEQTYRHGGEVHEQLQLDWMYLFHFISILNCFSNYFKFERFIIFLFNLPRKNQRKAPLCFQISLFW